jgi:hypothetical protein
MLRLKIAWKYIGYALAVSLGWTMYDKEIVVYSLAKLLSDSTFKNWIPSLVCNFPFAKQRKTQLKTLPLHQLVAFHNDNVTEFKLISTILPLQQLSTFHSDNVTKINCILTLWHSEQTILPKIVGWICNFASKHTSMTK